MSFFLQGLTLGLAYIAPIGMQNMFIINSALNNTRRRAFLTALIVLFFDVTLSLSCFFGIGRVMELTQNSARLAGTVTAGQVFVDGLGVGDVGSVVLRDRRHLAQDGMILVVMSMSGEDGSLVSGPDLITRGFVYVKESEGLMEELRQVALEAIQSVDGRYATDWSAIKGAIKGDLSNYLYKKTKRSPMILPVIMEV